MTCVLATDPGWSLLDPWFLAALPAVWLLFVVRMLRSRAALPAASVAPLRGLPKTLRARVWFLPLLLQAFALSAFAVALARPVTRDVIPLREQGVDILLVLDISSSMMATDMNDNGSMTRIEGARVQAARFAKARVNDRVGLLTFARFPELRCPLTLDQDALASFLGTVRTVPERPPENLTGIGVALAKAVTLLEDSDAKSKVIVLLSDGENNVPEILPDQAAKLAKDAGISVHCIGVGRGQVIDDLLFGQRVFKPEFKALKVIAKITEGQFHAAESDTELGEVYAVIDELEKVELEDPRFRTVELFLWPFLVGAGLFVLQLLVEFLWIRRVP